MKGALVCYTQAVQALQRAGVKLEAMSSSPRSCGEIEKTQWGEFTGKEYRGYGVGTHYLVNHGVLPDMCILGEPTDMALVLEHFGSLWVRISVAGNYVHTAFAEARKIRIPSGAWHDVLEAVRDWMPRWQTRRRYGGHQGIVNVGGIRGGHPWRASRTPERADLFLDVRVPPTMEMAEARRAIQAALPQAAQAASRISAWSSRPMSRFPAPPSTTITRWCAPSRPTIAA